MKLPNFDVAEDVARVIKVKNIHKHYMYTIYVHWYFLHFSKDNFTTYKKFERLKKILVGNGKVTFGYGQGAIRVEMLVDWKWVESHLRSVWYVPRIGQNRGNLSVGAICNKGFDFFANGKHCIFKKGNIVIAAGTPTQGIYFMKMRTVQPEKASKLMFIGTRNLVDTPGEPGKVVETPSEFSTPQAPQTEVVCVKVPVIVQNVVLEAR